MMFEGFQKLVELNLQAVKSTLAEGRENVGKALPANDPQDLVSAQARLIQPTTEKILLEEIEQWKNNWPW